MSEEEDGSAVSFEVVKEAEKKWIEESRSKRGVERNGPFVGLAFSGGGIRSATFNLGILQGLAKSGWLKRFDYLSTVSGGGYIGSWFQAWIQRAQGLSHVIKRFTHEETDSPHGKTHVEADEIHWLRDYSNYLTPRTGWFSADTWHMLSVYSRNLLLNLVILVIGGAALLLLPRLVLVFFTNSGSGALGSFLWLGFLCLAVATVFIGLNMNFFADGGSEEPRTKWYMGPVSVWLTVVLPVLLATWPGIFWLTNTGPGTNATEHPYSFWLLAGAGAYFFLWTAAVFYILLRKAMDKVAPSGWRWALIVIPAALTLWGIAKAFSQLIGFLPAGGVVSFLSLYGTMYLAFLVLTALVSWVIRRKQGGISAIWFTLLVLVLTAPLAGALGGLGLMGVRKLFMVLAAAPPAKVTAGPLILIIVFVLTATAHIGLMGLSFPDSWREWWARVGGQMLRTGLVVGFGFGVALYGPCILHWLQDQTNEWANPSLLAGWLSTTGVGVLWQNRAMKSGQATGFIMKVVPYAVILGLLLILSAGLHHGLESWDISKDAEAVGLATLALMSALAAWLLASRVDVNEFSMHLFYRVRLARAYLGASLRGRRRTAQPYTGFNHKDDILLKDIQRECGGPYPIVNTTINYSRGDEMATQTRKGGSFVFTPEYCGYTLAPHGQADNQSGRDCYRLTEEYSYADGGPFLGTAFAISGAAASPAMGYHTSVTWAFLMTVFNVRLGWWAGNPSHKRTWKTRGPFNSLLYLAKEIQASTRHTTPYVYLSDGGHFENLGLYELVRRECQLIVVCDAGADSDYQFGDLGSAIEKCRVDHGVNIKIDPTSIRPLREDKMGVEKSKMHYAVGEIIYPEGVEKGTLVYLKASVTGDEAVDVHNYDVVHKAFPHEPTVDQWFDERQFESYRALGEHISKQIFIRAADELRGAHDNKGKSRGKVRDEREQAVMGKTPEELVGALEDLFCQDATDAGVEIILPERLAQKQ